MPASIHIAARWGVGVYSEEIGPEYDDSTRPSVQGGRLARSGRSGRGFGLCFAPGHAVADARLGEDVGGVAGVFAQLAAELADDGAHGPQIAAALLSPDPCQQLLVGQHTPGAGREFGQHPVLHCHQRDRPPRVTARAAKSMVRLPSTYGSDAWEAARLRRAARIRAVNSVGEKGLTT